MAKRTELIHIKGITVQRGITTVKNISKPIPCCLYKVVFFTLARVKLLQF